MTRTVTAILAAALASVALVAGYLALGGGGFEPTPAPDPCGRRAQPAGSGIAGTAERVGLNALNAAACELGVPRERLLLSLAGETDLGVSAQERADAFRAGLRAAIDEEQRAGTLGPIEAGLLRQAVEFLPVDALLEQLFRNGG